MLACWQDQNSSDLLCKELKPLIGHVRRALARRDEGVADRYLREISHFNINRANLSIRLGT